MTSTINLTPINKITEATLANMDIETAIMACQSNRAQILEGELKSQVLAVQAKNEQVSRLNQARDALNMVMGKFDPNAKPTDTVSSQTALKTLIVKDRYGGTTLTGPIVEANNALTIAQVNPFKDASGQPAQITGTTEKSAITAAIDAIKSQIDALTNSQQMDMLRLQSLSAKRNESFETMTTLMKKFQGPRDSIIGNMR